MQYFCVVIGSLYQYFAKLV